MIARGKHLPGRAGSPIRDSVRAFLQVLFVIALLAGWLIPPQPVVAEGGAYSLVFTAADPRPNQGPYAPTYPAV